MKSLFPVIKRFRYFGSEKSKQECFGGRFCLLPAQHSLGTTAEEKSHFFVYRIQNLNKHPASEILYF